MKTVTTADQQQHQHHSNFIIDSDDGKH